MPEPTRPANTPAPAALVQWCSQKVLHAEKILAGALMALLLGLILLNVGTRFLRVPLYWVDEASILSMTWLAFIGASVMTRLRMDFAVTLLSDALPKGMAQRLQAAATALSLCFAIGLVVMCWNWMDPLGLAAAGFDAAAFAGQTFNFLYTEHTQTLEWPSWLVYLILPIFSVTLSLHLCANLLEDLGVAPRRAQMKLTSNGEGVA